MLYNAHAIGEWLNGRVVVSKTIGCVFESRLPCHVAVSCIVLAAIFYKSHWCAHFTASPFSKKDTLLACKRAYNALACYQPFSGYEGLNPPAKNIGDSFYLSPLHVVADYVSFATTFLFKKTSSHSRRHTSLRKTSRWLRLYPCNCRHDASTFCRFAPCGTGELFYSIFTRRNINACVVPFSVKNKRFFLRHTLRSKISITCEACRKSLSKTTGGILLIRIIFTKSLKNC